MRQVLLADADAVVGERDRALFGGVGKQPDEDVASAGIGRGVVREVAEYRRQQRRAADDFDLLREVDVHPQPLVGGFQLHVGRDLGDQVVQHDALLLDQLAGFVHARDGRDVGQQAAQALGLCDAFFQEVRASLRVERRVGQQCFQIALNRRHGGLQLVVDVVGELFLDAYLLLLLVQREGVLAVAVGGGFLQAGVEADDVARYFAQFVVGECREVVGPLAPLGPFGEFVQPGDVLAQAARGEVARHAHQQRHAQHEPEEFAVGGQYFAQRHGVGHGRTDDVVLAPHGRVEIVAVGAFGVAADGVTRTAGQRRGDLGAAEVVRAGQRVERIVEYDVSRRVDQRHPQLFAGRAGAGDEGVGRRACLHGVEHPQVEKLQLRVEPLGLEVLFAPVLEKDEAPHQRP